MFYTAQKMMRQANKLQLVCAGVLASVAISAATIFPTAQADEINRADEMTGEMNYKVPIAANRSDLLPYATLSISKYSVALNDDGVHVLRFNLPFDLTGGEIINLEMIENTPLNAEKVQFSNSNGFAECTGPDWDKMECTYRLDGLQLDKAKLDAYLDAKYKGTNRAGPAKEVAEKFSGEPIGEAKTFGKNGNNCLGCSLGNGEWKIVYTNQGSPIESKMSLDRTRGTYFNPGGSGSLKNVRYNDTTATGRWQFGNSTGWFRFEFDNEGQSFSGKWGNGADNSPQQGSWNGERIAD